MISDCLSGEGTCVIAEPICFITGQCDGEILRVIEHVPDRQEYFEYSN